MRSREDNDEDDFLKIIIFDIVIPFIIGCTLAINHLKNMK